LPPSTVIRDPLTLPRNEDLRGVLNSGQSKSTARVIRCVGDDHEPRALSTWAPKVVAMIGRLPTTVEDRAVVVRMRRKLAGEHVHAIRQDSIDRDLLPLRRKITGR
jgi:putative DNA primase/helicase